LLPTLDLLYVMIALPVPERMQAPPLKAQVLPLNAVYAPLIQILLLLRTLDVNVRPVFIRLHRLRHRNFRV